jgi:hypothetical protein
MQDHRALRMMILILKLMIIEHHLLFPMMTTLAWEKISTVKSMAGPIYVDLDGLHLMLKTVSPFKYQSYQPS